MRTRVLSIAALILANLLPLVGVLFFGWHVREVLLVYWAESAVIAIYNAVKMLACRAGAGPKPVLVVFFLVHFATFMFVHLMFIMVLTDGPMPTDPGWRLNLGDDAQRSMLLALGALVVSHGVEFIRWIGSGAARTTDARRQMMAPYGRVVVMHATILIGALAVRTIGEPVGLLLALIVIKIVIDLRTQQRAEAAVPLVPEGVAGRAPAGAVEDR